MSHGPFTPHTIQYLMPFQVQLFLVGICYYTPSFLAVWNKTGDYTQHQTDLNTQHENKACVDCDYKIGDKELLRKEGILCKSESKYHNDPWTISTVHINRTIRVQCGTKSEQLNIRRIRPYFKNADT